MVCLHIISVIYSHTSILGKTSILYTMKLGEPITTIPTIGFNAETINVKKGVTFTVWDVGGGCRIYPLWRHYFLKGIILDS